MEASSISQLYSRRSDFVDISIGLKALFRKNLTSVLLVLLFVFYTFFILYIEIFYFQTRYDKAQYLCLVPALYMLLNLLLNWLKRVCRNLDAFFIAGLAAMVALSLAKIGLWYSGAAAKEYVIIVLLVAQMIIFQKILFIQVVIYLVKVFDVSTPRLQNQMNSSLTPDLLNNIQLLANAASIALILPVHRHISDRFLIGTLPFVTLALNCAVLALLVVLFFYRKRVERRTSSLFLQSITRKQMFVSLRKAALVNEGKYVFYFIWGSNISFKIEDQSAEDLEKSMLSEDDNVSGNAPK